MIKDVFKFSKTSWHAKLMEFVWGYKATDFRNMCPYFWLSVVNIVFILPILIAKFFIVGIKLAGRLLGAIITSVDSACESKAAIWLEDKVDKVFQDTDYADLVINAGITWGDTKSHRNLRKVWFNIPVMRRQELVKAYEIRKELWAVDEAKVAEERRELNKLKREREEKGRASKAARIGKITMIIKKVVNIIKWPVFAGLLYLLYIGVVFLFNLFTSLDYSWIPNFLYDMYIVIGTAVGIVLFLIPVCYFASWISCRLKGMCLPCEIRQEKLIAFFMWFKWLAFTIYPFIGLWWLLKQLWSGIVTFIELLIAIKQDNCPGVEWED